MSTKNLIVVVGPTAVGKTALGIEIAKAYNTEIISCDSRQFFKEMKIGTAKPSAQELQTVKHHFIDSHSIHDTYSVGDFERDALSKLETLFQTHDNIVMVGGSGLYVKILCDGIDNFPKTTPEIREQLKNDFEEKGIDYLQQELLKLDPDYYNEVDINNTQRVIRALEVCKSSGTPFSSYRTSSKVKRDFNIVKIGINQDRETLYKRINFRVDLMIQAGLLEDARELYPLKSNNALQTVGYQELFSHFDNEITLENAIELIKRNTRRYAKRQLTWFKKDEEIKWFEAGENHEINKYLNAFIGTD